MAKLGEAPTTRSGEVPILELIASGEVRLVVNTPTPRSGAVRDAAGDPPRATGEGILCLTAIETAVAAAEALDPAIAERRLQRPSAGEWVPEPGSAAGWSRPPEPRRSSGVTTIAWPSDHSVSVVRATITTASGTWRAVGGRPSDRPARRAPRPRGPPTPRACARRRPRRAAASRRARRQPRPGRLEEGGPEQVPARWNGSEIAMTIRCPSISR